jgi:TRAP-type C4-dicarboxylate transport system substrate-binding protein
MQAGQSIARWFGAAAVVVVAGLLVHAGAAVAQPQALTLKWALITPETFPYMDGARKFKELIEQRSGSRIRVEIFPGGQLGAERDINEAILEGAIHIGVGAGAMANLAPIYNLVQVPFLLQGQDHMERVALGPTGAKIARRIEEQARFRVLAWFSTGDSAIETVKKPVRHPNDLRGVKIRIIENPILRVTFLAFAANPTPMPYTEIYTGLRQGVIEGAHLDVVSVDALKIYEIAKYITDWEQIAFLAEPRPVIMNAKFVDSLPEADRKLIQDAMLEAAAHERRVFRERMKTIRRTLVEKGMQITQVDAEAFVTRVRPIWRQWATDLKAEDILDDIVKLRR